MEGKGGVAAHAFRTFLRTRRGNAVSHPGQYTQRVALIKELVTVNIVRTKGHRATPANAHCPTEPHFA
eukprot:371810-Pelagomonas_calceolata.AAC.1